MFLSYLQKLLCKIQREAAGNEESSDGSDLISKSFVTQRSTSTCSSNEYNVRKNTRELWRAVNDICCSKDDLFKNRACKQDHIGPGWKFRFYREKFGAQTSNEVGRLQTEMVMVSFVFSCKWSFMRLGMGDFRLE